VLRVPRAQALRLARLERDALLWRAAQDRSCAPLWRAAADHADRMISALQRRDDVAALDAMYAVAGAWKRAARCRGLPRRVRGAH
jgi:hypothetical protein